MADPLATETDLLGNRVPPKKLAKGLLAKRFGLPPFSVLNAREGAWQARKRAWVALGIQSEVGRGGNLLELSDSCEQYRQRADDYAGRPGELPTASLKDGLTFGLTQSPYTDPEKVKKKRAAEAKREESALLSMEQMGGREPVVAHARVQGSSQPGLVHHLTTQAYRGKGKPVSAADCGTSIFDPVLCELMYEWFCPPGGQVLDPFAGGSVRGIVAGVLGRRYWGSELSEVQVKANRVQAKEILGQGAGTVRIKISAASARQRFHGCEPEYIRDVCHASCCRSSSAEGGALVTIHPSEEGRIEARGGLVRHGLLVVEDGCGFQSKKTHLCKLHETPDKPFGCIASPFTLNKNDTLIVRNRYRTLKCYEDGDDPKPAFQAFRASLDRILGPVESARVCGHLLAGGDDTHADIPAETYRMLKDNDAIKKGETPGGAGPVTWVCGDSAETLSEAPEADMIFGCPPYADLEVYSKDPRDLSNMPYPQFRAAYTDIILKACERLKEDRFAVFVVGDARGPDGNYYNFPAHTTAAFRKAGLQLYNEAILITAVGSLSIRMSRQFVASRKMGTTHQRVIVYVKGDPVRATDAVTAMTKQERMEKLARDTNPELDPDTK